MATVPSNRKSSPVETCRSSGRTPKLAILPFCDASVAISSVTLLPPVSFTVVCAPVAVIAEGMMFIAGEPMKRATKRLAGRS
ncbi:hypothetical protein D9M70_549010 [compost metagenome]